jgi:cyclic peptide transporter
MLKRYLRDHAWALLGATLLSGLGGFVTIRLLAYINALAANGIQDTRLALKEAGLLLLALLLTSVATQVLLVRLGGDLVEQLRTELGVRLLAADYEKLAARGDAVYGAIVDDLSRMGQLVVNGPPLAYNALLIVLFSGYLIHVSTPLYAVFVVAISPALGVAFLVEVLTRRQFDGVREADETFYQYLRNIGPAKKELTLNRARAAHFEARVLRPAVTHARAMMSRLHLAWMLNESWSAVAINGAIFFVVFYGYTALALPPATIVQFVLGSLCVIGPLNFFAATAQAIGGGLASLRHLERVGVDLAADVQSTRQERAAAREDVRWDGLHLDGVSYRYAPATGKEVVRGVGPLTFTLRRGESLFLVGGNGSGKSTLLLLLCGLLTPCEGELRLDGRGVRENLERYRAMFCGTFSDAFVFRHVMDALGEPMKSDDVKNLLRQCGLEGQVQGDGGQFSRLDLSTGQRKRLALIQSLAQDREIFFFDEWAAEQDPVFREFFYRSVLPDLKRRGKTLVVISHDDRYFHLADRVLTLEQGLIVSEERRMPEPSARPIAGRSACP